MKRILGRTFFAVAASTLLLGALPALAGDGNDQGENENGGSRRTSRSVPEFDPTTAGAIAAILVGGGALLARRRR
jgi:hypothetical protein